MFADDTSVFFQNKNYHSFSANAQQDLHNIDRWMIANKLYQSILPKQNVCCLGQLNQKLHLLVNPSH